MKPISGARALVGRSVIALAIGGVLLCRPLHAQPSDAALAESLFREGKRLIGEGKPAEACPKFAESYRLDAGLGTLLNLAACHEAEGKLATAWAEFTEAETRARRENDATRADFANSHVRALDPRLSRLKIEVSPEATLPDLDLAIDDRHVSPAAWGLPVPVDPGAHRFAAAAPGRQPWSAVVTAPAEGQTLSVTIPVLVPAAAVAAPVPVAVAPVAAPVAVAPAPAPAPKKSGVNVPFVVSASAAGLFTVGAVVTGVMYSQKQSEFEQADDDHKQSRYTLHDEAQTLGVANLVLVGAAVVSAGLAVTFYALASGDEKPRAARLVVAPVVTPSGAGVFVQGAL